MNCNVSQVFGFQAAFPTIPGLRSSALRLTIGGEL